MGPEQQALQETGGGGSPAGSAGVTTTNPPGLTANTIPKASGASALVDSAITDDGAQVTSTNRSVLLQINDALAGAVLNVLTIRHSTTGAAVNGIGVSEAFVAEDDAGQAENIAQIDALLTSVVSGSEVSRVNIRARAIGDGGNAAVALAIEIAGIELVPLTARILVPQTTNTGASPVTIDKMKGRVRIAAGTSAIRVINALSIATSEPLIQQHGATDATGVLLSVVNSTPGEFTITCYSVAGVATNATANIDIGFVLFQ